jgi:methionyl-tRNA synthetase
LGEDVVTLCGGDENALKNVQAAEKAGKAIGEFVDQNNLLFQNLAIKLNAQYSIWQKGSDANHHYASSQKLWQLCKADIYKKTYKGLYCVGCEAFYTPDELNEKGECFEHPGKKLETVEENNYFFNLKKYEDQIKKKIISGELEIIPDKRKNETLAFLERGLEDISISRSNQRAKNWGVPVPNDTDQRMYVWFDALNIYQSGIGFGWNDQTYAQTWPADIHVIGKGITRFHAVYWPAFLLSAKLKLPKTIFVHEYFTVNGQKMSKTLGNVIDPVSLIDTYGTDALRYYFLAQFSPFNDGDFSEEEFKKTYNANLANGLGNLIARVAKLASTTEHLLFPKIQSYSTFLQVNPPYQKFMDEYRFNDAISYIWSKIKTLDILVNTEKPWDKKGADLTRTMNSFIRPIQEIASLLQPFMPETAQKILAQFKGPRITSQPALFPRIV